MLDHIDRERFRGETVGVVTGGASAERDISLETGKGFARALDALGYDVRVYDVPDDCSRLEEERPAAVILGLHGGAGENGVLQGYLEMLRIPYTGSGVLASALGIDKRRTKAVLESSGIATPGGTYVGKGALRERDRDAAALLEAAELELPVVVKPNDEGSSVGVEVCETTEQVGDALADILAGENNASSAGALVEEYLDGPEFTVGFFDQVCLGSIRVVPGETFYDFEAKYESDDTRYEEVDDGVLAAELETVGRAAYEAVGCRGVARIDFKSRDTDSGLDLRVLELNTIPGMTATSLVPKLARRHGIDFESFTEYMLASAGCETSWST